jgi:hypothetical protein
MNYFQGLGPGTDKKSRRTSRFAGKGGSTNPSGKHSAIRYGGKARLYFGCEQYYTEV